MGPPSLAHDPPAQGVRASRAFAEGLGHEGGVRRRALGPQVDPVVVEELGVGPAVAVPVEQHRVLLVRLARRRRVSFTCCSHARGTLALTSTTFWRSARMPSCGRSQPGRWPVGAELHDDDLAELPGVLAAPRCRSTPAENCRLSAASTVVTSGRSRGEHRVDGGDQLVGGPEHHRVADGRDRGRGRARRDASWWCAVARPWSWSTWPATVVVGDPGPEHDVGLTAEPGGRGRAPAVAEPDDDHHQARRRGPRRRA